MAADSELSQTETLDSTDAQWMRGHNTDRSDVVVGDGGYHHYPRFPLVSVRKQQQLLEQEEEVEVNYCHPVLVVATMGHSVVATEVADTMG